MLPTSSSAGDQVLARNSQLGPIIPGSSGGGDDILIRGIHSNRHIIERVRLLKARSERNISNISGTQYLPRILYKDEHSCFENSWGIRLPNFNI